MCSLFCSTCTMPSLVAHALNPTSGVGLALVAGGQGYTYIEELRALAASKDGLPELFTALAAALSEEVANATASASGLWPEGLDILGWLSNPDSTPDMAYLCSAPVSYPLIYATQLAHYAVAIASAGVQQDQMVSVLKGATGHSQGVVTAAVIASSSDDATLVANAAAGAKYMLWQGARCHQVLNTAVAYSGPTPQASPMLAVAGLTKEALSKVCAQFNANAGAPLTVRIYMDRPPRAWNVRPSDILKHAVYLTIHTICSHFFFPHSIILLFFLFFFSCAHNNMTT